MACWLSSAAHLLAHWLYAASLFACTVASITAEFTCSFCCCFFMSQVRPLKRSVESLMKSATAH
jgi:hypothetical protein